MRRITVITTAALFSTVLVHAALAQDEPNTRAKEATSAMEITESNPSPEITVTEPATTTTVSLPASDSLLSEMKVYPAF